MAGSGTLTKVDSGTLILSGVNTYSGSTTISAGTISISADSGLGSAPGSATAPRDARPRERGITSRRQTDAAEHATAVYQAARRADVAWELDDRLAAAANLSGWS